MADARMSSFRENTPLEIILETRDEGDDDDNDDELNDDDGADERQGEEDEGFRTLDDIVGESEGGDTSRTSSPSTVVSHPEFILLLDQEEALLTPQEETLSLAQEEAGDSVSEMDRESVMVSEEEMAEWDRKMQQQEELLQRHSEEFKAWEENMNQRRLVAFGRLKNLKRQHVKRMNFYSMFTEYVKDAEFKMKNKTDSQKQKTAEGFKT